MFMLLAKRARPYLLFVNDGNITCYEATQLPVISSDGAHDPLWTPYNQACYEIDLQHQNEQHQSQHEVSTFILSCPQRTNTADGVFRAAAFGRRNH